MVLGLMMGVVLVTAVWLYGRGWQRQPVPDARTLVPHPWRVATFLLACLLLCGVLFSPLHRLATSYFSIHVFQRLLLITLIPLLFFSGNPLPILYAGLPLSLRTALRQFLQNAPQIISFIRTAFGPLPVWFLFAATFWLWHDVQVDRLLLQSEWLHRVETITLLGTAVLYWWHILAASPRLHAPLPLLWRVAYAALGASPIKLVGLVLLFAETAVYQYPAEIHLKNSTLDITDQSLGAGLIWILGGIVFTWTAVLLMRDWLQEEDEKPKLPESAWATEEMMLAPGFRSGSS